MVRKQQETVICQICGEKKKRSEVVPAEMIREPLVEIIRKTHPNWSSTGFICVTDLNSFRANYVQNILETERGELTALEEEVVKSLREQELLSKNINLEFSQHLTFGEHLADRLADFAGSWRFISLFGIMLLVWIAINSIVLLYKPFDPYPFILLNLILSCLAAIQAPIIMMSQNRQEAKDRMRAEYDYLVNLKAELEIRHLHEKVDYLLRNQWQRLLEIQEIQLELMAELTHKTSQ